MWIWFVINEDLIPVFRPKCGVQVVKNILTCLTSTFVCGMCIFSASRIKGTKRCAAHSVLVCSFLLTHSTLISEQNSKMNPHLCVPVALQSVNVFIIQSYTTQSHFSKVCSFNLTSRPPSELYNAQNFKK